VNEEFEFPVATPLASSLAINAALSVVVKPLPRPVDETYEPRLPMETILFVDKSIYPPRLAKSVVND